MRKVFMVINYNEGLCVWGWVLWLVDGKSPVTMEPQLRYWRIATDRDLIT
jgi:hypothetical protein